MPTIRIKKSKGTNEEVNTTFCFLYILSLFLLSILWTTPGFAQDVERVPDAQVSTSETVYTPDYFNQYAPVTAADMVGLLPNFTLTVIDTKRGLGQGGVNVLINNVRLSGKNNDAISALSRIPATSVARLEVLDGASLDIPGLSGNVVNIITNHDAFSGSWKYRAEFQNRSRSNLFGFEGSVSGSSGDIEYNIGLKSEPFRDSEAGTEIIVDAQGNLIETRDEFSFLYEDNPTISSEITYTPDNGHVGHLNASYQFFNVRFDDQSIQSAVTPAGVDGQRLTNGGEDKRNWEIGGDYAFDVGKGNLKLIALSRTDDIEFSDRFRMVDNTGAQTIDAFNQDVREKENIVRAEYSFKENEKRDWQFSVEGAFNRLDSDAALFESDALGELVEVPFPNGTTRVKEDRAEANVTVSQKVTDRLKIQTSLGVEYSEISQTQPDIRVSDFVRPKGFISASYDASDSLTIRGKVERTVDQLDFFTFVSSVDLDDNLANAGNPGIVPAQSWDGEIEIEKNWDNGLSGTVKVYGQHIDDLVDRVLLADGGDAPGNIDNANVVGVEFVGTALLDQFGLEGGRIDIELEARNTSVTDPLTSVDRRFSDSMVSRYEIDFRHDIPNTDWAWGGLVENFREAPGFRLNQVMHFTRGQPDVQFFVENKDIFGLTVRADVRNILSADFNFRRNIWDGDNRAVGNFVGFEQRTRNASPQYGITVSRTF